VNTEERHILEKALSGLEKAELVALLLDQAQRIEKLEGEVSHLGKELQTALRAEKRQAAPFRKSEVKENPKPRGRDKGHKGHYRTASGEATESAESPLETCPVCGGQLRDKQPIDQVVEEIPPVRLRIVRLRTWQGHCCRCGEVRSTNPLQVGTATGSAKVQLGPGAISWVLKLRHRYGLSVSNSCKLLKDAFGLPLTPGAVCHMEQRLSRKLQPDYAQLLEQARQAERIHADETSWYVGGPGHWLWVFANDGLTLYEVNPSRGRDVLEKVLGKDFKGTLVSDCLSPYEDFCQHQHKCYAHHLKAIKDALKVAPQSQFLRVLRRMLRQAIIYKGCKEILKPPEYQVLCQHLERWADQLLPVTVDEKGKPSLDAQACPFNLLQAEQQVGNRLAKRRKHLFTFLYHDDVPATNNLAERQLRPAVIQRKISCGNKTAKGAHAWQVIRSICVSNHQQQKNFSDSICQALKRDLLSR